MVEDNNKKTRQQQFLDFKCNPTQVIQKRKILIKKNRISFSTALAKVTVMDIRGVILKNGGNRLSAGMKVTQTRGML